jgi:hypothetical protein
MKLCQYAECLCAECRDLYIGMLNVVILSVVMLSVVAPQDKFCHHEVTETYNINSNLRC